MKTFPRASVDQMIRDRKVKVCQEAPVTVYDLDNLYIYGPYHPTETTFISLREASDAVFGRFIRQWTRLKWVATFDEVTRFNLVTDLYARECVHGAYCQIFAFK